MSLSGMRVIDRRGRQGMMDQNWGWSAQARLHPYHEGHQRLSVDLCVDGCYVQVEAPAVGHQDVE